MATLPLTRNTSSCFQCEKAVDSSTVSFHNEPASLCNCKMHRVCLEAFLLKKEAIVPYEETRFYVLYRKKVTHVACPSCKGELEFTEEKENGWGIYAHPAATFAAEYARKLKVGLETSTVAFGIDTFKLLDRFFSLFITATALKVIFASNLHVETAKNLIHANAAGLMCHADLQEASRNILDMNKQRVVGNVIDPARVLAKAMKYALLYCVAEVGSSYLETFLKDQGYIEGDTLPSFTSRVMVLGAMYGSQVLFSTFQGGERLLTHGLEGIIGAPKRFLTKDRFYDAINVSFGLKWLNLPGKIELTKEDETIIEEIK